MRVLILLAVLIFLTVSAQAQECGYTFLRLYVQTPMGKPVSDAEIKTYEKDFKTELYLYPKSDDQTDHLKRSLRWNKESQSYNGSEGMCGGHRQVGFRISAPGFENFDLVTDLPLGWTAYLVTLKPVDTADAAKSIKLVRIAGKISDGRERSIPKVHVSAVQQQTIVFGTLSAESGAYEVYLPPGKYDLRFAHAGFKQSVYEAFDVSDGRHRRLDLVLEASDVTTHPNIKNQ
jgi:hypothetical protein